jgi:acyl carrier protein
MTTLNVAEISKVLAKMIADKLEIDPETVTLQSNLKEIGLDSLDTFDLIFDAEDHFAIKVPNDKVNIETLEDVAKVVHELVLAKEKSAA